MGRLFEIIRPPVEPLAEGTLWVQWQTWFDRLFKYVENTVLRGVVTGDANASILPNQSYHGVSALTAGRTLTLPKATTVEDNHFLVIQDESGAAGTHTITVAAFSGDTLRGTNSISSNYGRLTLIRSGASMWYSK